MNAFAMQEFISSRRDALIHTEEDFKGFCEVICKGQVPDYQISAWLMAAFLNPLSQRETAQLTVAMANSGQMLDLTDLPKPWVDKHSTGGVGDKTTLVILPLLAAMGLTMVKMSGRALGITGGTVDKLESVPGFRMNLTSDELISQAKLIGISITGQTESLAPADKILYGLRDATETVESIPLIVSSILSKKFASGAETILIDVKCGSGAFMKTLQRAIELKEWLEAIGVHAGRKIKAAITDMSQPLGETVGNVLEVDEAIRVLKNEVLSPSSARFRDLVVQLAGEAAVEAGIAADLGSGQALASRILASGQATSKAEKWFEAQGATHFSAPIQALEESTLESPVDGWVETIDAGDAGRVVLKLRGGRQTKADVIDPQVGLIIHLPVGSPVTKGQPIVTVRARQRDEADQAISSLRPAIRISPQPVAPPSLIIG